MRCRHVRRRLVAFQDDELSPGEAVRVREHLAACEACRAREAKLRAVTPMPARPVRPVVDPDWSRLDATLDHAAVTPIAPGTSAWPAPLAMVAYGLLVGGLLGWGMHNWLRASALESQITGQPAIAVDGSDTAVPADALVPASWAPTDTDAP